MGEPIGGRWYLPEVECPKCGHVWHEDDYYDLIATAEKHPSYAEAECPKCEALLEGVESEPVVRISWKLRAKAEGDDDE